jgi:hypothetical protein
MKAFNGAFLGVQISFGEGVARIQHSIQVELIDRPGINSWVKTDCFHRSIEKAFRLFPGNSGVAPGLSRGIKVAAGGRREQGVQGVYEGCRFLVQVVVGGYDHLIGHVEQDIAVVGGGDWINRIRIASLKAKSDKGKQEVFFHDVKYGFESNWMRALAISNKTPIPALGSAPGWRLGYRASGWNIALSGVRKG